MARPQRNTVDYFPHMIGDGKKIFSIESKYKNDGYATWFKILERLAVTDYHYLNLNDDGEIMYLAAKCSVSEDVLFSIISDLSRLNVFDKTMWENKIVWCQPFVDSIQDAYERRTNKCMTLDGLCKHLTGLGMQLVGFSILKGNKKPQTILKDIKEDNITVVPPVKKSSKKPVSSESSLYTRMVDVWLKEIHLDWTFSAIDGKKMKSIEGKIRALFKMKNRSDTDDDITNFFRLMCVNFSEFHKDKELKVIDSDFNTVIENLKKIKNGQPKPPTRAQQTYSDVKSAFGS